MAVVGLAAFCGACAGCGDETLPDGVVAKVRDHAITQDAVRRAVVGQIAIRHSAASMPSYLPGDVHKCVAIRAQLPLAERLSRRELRRRCERERDRREAAALRLLILREWYLLDRDRRGVPIPTARRLARWIAEHAGVAVEDARGVAETQLMRQRLTQGLISRLRRASPRQIASYYRAHRNRYRDPGKRFGQWLIVPRLRQADVAAAMLRRGRSIERIAGAQGAGRAAASLGSASLIPTYGHEDEEALSMKRGDVGIARRGRGWIAYRIDDVIPPRQHDLAKARTQVENDLRLRQLKNGLAAYEARLRSEYERETVCADGHDLPECA